jgi:hypothetical protein
MEGVSMPFLRIQERIWTILMEAGATSIDRAVAVQEAQFDMQEQNWLNYIAGGLFARAKKRHKTSDTTTQIAAKLRLARSIVAISSCLEHEMIERGEKTTWENRRK